MTKEIRQEMVDKLQGRSKEDILKELKKRFVEEDTKEPFVNREYVEDTLQVFDMLISGDEDDFIGVNGGALCDVISDIFRYYGEY